MFAGSGRRLFVLLLPEAEFGEHVEDLVEDHVR
jgi:hypothetical protein